MNRSRLSLWLGAALLFGFGSTLSLYWGLSGIADDADPLFYGGWLAAKGGIPFVNMFTSWGMVQAVIQGAFFRILGPTWLAYCLHAAMVNGIYTVLACVLFRRMGLGWGCAAAYALMAATTYYAPMGYPHPDKEGFVFLFAALVLQAGATEQTPSHITKTYFAAGLMLILSFLCKPSPAGLFPLAAVVPFLSLSGHGKIAAFKGVSASFAALVLVGCALLPANPHVFGDFIYYYFGLALHVMAGRTAENAGLSLMKLSDYAQFGAIPLAFGLALAASAAVCYRRPFAVRAMVPAALGLAFLIITLFHLRYLKQPAGSQVTLVIPAIALFHAAILALFPRSEDTGRMVALVLAVTLVVTSGIHTREYDRLVNKTRRNYDRDFVIGEKQKRGTAGIPELAWVEPIPIRSAPNWYDRFRDVMAEMKATDGNVALVGLSQMFYVFGAKAPVQPSIYMIRGHSSPMPDSSQGERLGELMFRSLEKAEVRTILVHPDFQNQLVDRLTAAGGAPCRVVPGPLVSRVELCRPISAEDHAVAKVLYDYANHG